MPVDRVGYNNMADNFNIDLGAAARGADEVNSMPFHIAQNAATTMQQEQLVAQAMEHTKQAKLSTQQQQAETDTSGFLSEKGQVPKAQALSEMKLMLQKEGWTDDDIANALSEADSTWPDVVNAYDIRGFISALRKEKGAAPVGGTPFKAGDADAAKEDENGEALVPGQYYKASVDDKGNNTYIRSGEPAAEVQAAGKGARANGKELKEFGKEITGLMKTRFGATGMLATTVFRADRALNTLHSTDVLTKQDLNNISTDIAAIYQGGVPGQQQIVENAYGTSLTNLMDTLRHYTGVLSGFGMNQGVLADTKAKLTSVLTDMRNSALASMKQIFEGLVSHYPSLSPTDPAVQKVIEDTMAGLGSGLLNEKHEVMPPTGDVPMAGAAPAAPAPAAGGEQKTKSGISFTVGQ